MNTRVPRNHPRGAARSAIVRSARELFGSRGYDGASMRDIARHAQVSEALLYRYFGAKRGLFEEAVGEPYRQFIDDFLSDWGRLNLTASNEEMVSRFVGRLYEFVRTNRNLIFALAAVDHFGDADRGAAGALSEGIHRLAEFSVAESEDRGYGQVDIEMVVSCTIALVMAMGILDDLLFSAGSGRPTTERLISEMSKYALAGIVQTPSGTADTGRTR